jgi:hypothetical protein
VPIVCLIGFSTCGKTTLKEIIREKFPDYLYEESDDAASGTYPNLRQICLELVKEDGVTTGANNEIEQNERNFLRHSLMMVGIH